MYNKAEAALKKALLNGDNINEIKDKEKIFTEIAIQRHRASNPEDFGETPADSNPRKR
ncbi:MAG TPA: hypothetical protein VGO09_10760 [Flavisolibacter sp.]|nr:hypothetical protein [Flavisolibacter sp.]